MRNVECDGEQKIVKEYKRKKSCLWKSEAGLWFVKQKL